VIGRLPEGYISELREKGMSYIPRDGTMEEGQEVRDDED
jgi:hypothetical protein